MFQVVVSSNDRTYKNGTKGRNSTELSKLYKWSKGAIPKECLSLTIRTIKTDIFRFQTRTLI